MLIDIVYLMIQYQLQWLSSIDDRVIVNYLLQRPWKEVDMANFKVLFQNLPGRTIGNDKTPQEIQSMGQVFKLRQPSMSQVF
jgi:hypothetical protein